MGQFIQTNGDYNIKTAEGANIKLDTGPGVGNVRVTGNLIVEGDTLTVSAENLNVTDNVIVLNFGETGSGVTLRYSGIEIDRGSQPPATIVYDENDDVWNFAKGTLGTYNFVDSAIRVKSILTNADTDSGDLTLIGTGTGVVKVSGTTAYELQVTDDDDIPNKKYVDDAIQLSPTYQIKSPGTAPTGDSRVIVADKDVSPNIASEPGSLAAYTDQTGYSTFGESAVSILVDGALTAQFLVNRATIQNLEFLDNEITNNSTNGNISLRTQGTGKIQLNYALQLENLAVTPAYVAGNNLIFAAVPAVGDSGIFFANSQKNDELISRNKALIFSMLF